jgi:hypothetical protein
MVIDLDHDHIPNFWIRWATSKHSLLKKVTLQQDVLQLISHNELIFFALQEVVK